MSLIPHLSRPLWLLAFPVLLWLLWTLWHRPRRVGHWQRLLPTAFHEWLLTTPSRDTQRLPLLLFGLGAALAILALSGPSWQRAEQPAYTRTDPLVIVLDMTPDMLASDVSPSRLIQAQHTILDLLAARRDAETAIVVYAGSSHVLVPLTNDLHTAQSLLEAVRPAIMPEAGERADLAVRQALQLLRQGSGTGGRVLLITSQLSNQEQKGIREALSSYRVPLLMLGMGTLEGAPMAREEGGYLTDNQGNILLSRLDEATLLRFAQSVGAQYQRQQPDERDLRALGLLDTPDTVAERQEQVRLDAWVDQGYWLLIPVLILAACAGRKGWLLCIPLLLFVMPPPAHAFAFEDLWLRKDQQGARLLEAQRSDEAARRFENREWRGVAQYEAGQYEEAAKTFAQGNSAVDHYNRANALAKAGQLTGALDAYDQALRLQSNFPEALHNRALVEALLKQQQEQATAQDATPNEAGSDDQHSQSDTQAQPSPQNSDATDEPRAASNHDESGQPVGQISGEASDSEAVETEEENDDLLSQPHSNVLSEERRQSLEQWLREIPDDPAELLRRKFWHQQQQKQENRTP
ncbi:VWA domain-containing protein [Pseudomonas luteola]|uniref:VWA domain-containing protein n=1 Tax=Pseudomonas luteola TaxID=47886 RepID=UPI001EF5F0A7|nr:VWA domain-containing protein [Pseudomonas luteola]MCG7371333.1 VWA domain-containing protein [Pseudomonas luteola]